MNETLQGILILLSALWLVIIGSTITTHNFRSALWFKVTPFLLGVSGLYIGCKMIGVIP
jgi:hypothetical protein